MSRKQSQFLDNLLSDKAADELPAPRQRPNSLLARENVLSRLATGEVKQVTELRLDPARCRIWEGNGRSYAALSGDSCKDLIDSIVAEGGQRVPVIVRHLKNDPDHEFELMVGTRRHWSIAWLRTHNYPDMTLLAHVHDIDDEAAFRLADLENRVRTDLSDLERARNYAQALQRHYEGVQARMAERLRISQSWLTKMLALAHLPDTIVAAYPTPHAIQVNGGYEIASLLNDRRAAELVIAQAESIAAEQQLLRQKNGAAIPGPEVTRRLLNSAREKRGRRVPVPVLSAAGRPLLSIIADRADGLTLRIHPQNEATETEIAARVADAVRVARISRPNEKKRHI
jgi:ParB family transcriptional regulator, chromosome partitioning protein